MQLSVIIVNYNVKLFLEQCLKSVENAIKEIEAEVLVVDNNSSDDSLGYLTPRFPAVKFIASKENLGFAKANNLAVQMATGAYILFLNPDTLVPENCFSLCLRFMADQPTAGALGTKMIDGSGRFLRESKRAFPSPLTSFFKLTGLATLLPKSRVFARYHLGHLDADESHEIDVLAGAFMLVRRQVLDVTGAFDEMFFMYGEDIDLSFRIQNAGWKNYYFAGTSIVHFKGESTKKGSLNYVRMFYQAMSLFVTKHYGGSAAATFNAFIQLAIWLRAGLSAIATFIRKIGLPLMDASIIMFSLWVVKKLWGTYIKPGSELMPYVWENSLVVFTVLFILSGSMAGLYDKGYRPLRSISAMFLAIITNLAVYSLMEAPYRFSRGIILFGGMLAAILIIIFRWILVRSKVIINEDELHEYRKTLVVASEQAFDETSKMMEAAGRNERILGRVATNQQVTNSIGELHAIEALFQNIPAKEVIFCLDNTLSLCETMPLLKPRRNLRYKFHYGGTQSLVGSDSKNSSGETVMASMSFNIGKPRHRRFKRLADIISSLLFLISFPIQLFLIKMPGRFFINLVTVLVGQKTWVGYHAGPHPELPPLKPAIISPGGKPVQFQDNLTAEGKKIIDFWYAKDYQWTDDVKLIVKSYRWLGM